MVLAADARNLECSVCLGEYSNADGALTQPVSMNACGHSVCLGCCNELAKVANVLSSDCEGAIQCPLCENFSRLPLNKNYGLIDALSQLGGRGAAAEPAAGAAVAQHAVSASQAGTRTVGPSAAPLSAAAPSDYSLLLELSVEDFMAMKAAAAGGPPSVSAAPAAGQRLSGASQIYKSMLLEDSRRIAEMGKLFSQRLRPHPCMSTTAVSSDTHWHVVDSYSSSKTPSQASVSTHPPLHLFDYPPKPSRDSVASGPNCFGTIPEGIIWNPINRVTREQYQFGGIGTEDGHFGCISGVAVDSTGRVIVLDTSLCRVQIFGSDTRFICKFGDKGVDFGCFLKPSGVAVGVESQIVVADTGNCRIQIFNSSGEFITCFSTLESSSTRLFAPRSVAVCAISGTIFVLNREAHAIYVYAPSGRYITHFGGLGQGSGFFNTPADLVVDNDGHIIVADEENCLIQIFDSECRHIRNIRSQDIRKPFKLAVDARGLVVVACRSECMIALLNQSSIRDGRTFNIQNLCGASSVGGIGVDIYGHIIIASAYDGKISLLTTGYLPDPYPLPVD